MPPVYSIASFAVTVAYVPWFADAANAPRWVLLSLLVPWAWRVREWTAVHIAGDVFLVVALLSLLWTPVPIEGLQPLWQFILLGALFCIGFEMETLELVFVGAGWGIAVSSAVALFQHEPTGLFLNKNFMAEAAVLIAVGLMVYKRWELLPMLAPAIFLPLSRGALLAFGVALTMHRRSAWWAASLVLAYMTLVIVRPDGASLGERYVIWTETLRHLTWFGHGLGSFYIDFPSFQDGGFARRFDHAHNDLLELTYEFGLLLAPLLLVCSAAMWQYSQVWLVMAVFMVEGCFGFPLFMPVTGALGALAAGHLCSSWYRLRYDIPVRKHPLCLRTRQFGLRRREVPSAASG